MLRRLLLLALFLLPCAAQAQEVPLVAALSRTDIEVSTGFTGASLVVFGSTEQPIGPGGDEVLVIARGPTRPVVVRRKVPVAGVVWVNGPSARFDQVPGYYVIAGSRLFHARLPLPAAVPTGDYHVEVLLVRSRRILAREELLFRVDRVGAADRIATVAQTQPLLYGLACIAAAALAGWLGSVLFRRG